MTRSTVVIPDDYPSVLAASRAYSELCSRCRVRYYDSLPGSEEALSERVAGADVVINIRASSRFTERVFARAARLRLISIWGTGTDNVDLQAAVRHGITVTNTPGVSAPAVAEHALALMLAAARRIPQIDTSTRQGHWARGDIVLLQGKTLGIIGLGAVGRAFARLGAGIGMRVIAWTMHPRPGVDLVSLEELYRTADVVSLHLRLSPETRGFIGRPQFELMRPSAIFVNTARGAIVDEAALVEALSTRRIAAAGLDVFEQEPLPSGHVLTQLENVVLTPHSAGVATEVVEAGLELAVRNVWNFLDGSPSHVVAQPAK